MSAISSSEKRVGIAVVIQINIRGVTRLKRLSSGLGVWESVVVMGSPRKKSTEGMLTSEDVARLYVSGRADLFRLAWLAVGDAHLAEEFVQEAYTRLWAHPERVRDASKVDAYVRSIVLNLARSRHTARTRRGHFDVRIVNDPTGAGRKAESDPMRGADDRTLIADALDDLSPNQRICVVCRYWLGLTDTETAQATGMATGTVKTHLRRALSTMRKTLTATEVATLEANHVR